MAVTDTDLKAYVNASNSDDEFITSCLEQATALVTRYNRVWDSLTGVYGPSAAPTAVVDRAVLEVASELFHRRNAPNGVAQFASLDGSPIRVARDPMVGAYPLLNAYVVTGF